MTSLFLRPDARYLSPLPPQEVATSHVSCVTTETPLNVLRRARNPSCERIITGAAGAVFPGTLGKRIRAVFKCCNTPQTAPSALRRLAASLLREHLQSPPRSALLKRESRNRAFKLRQEVSGEFPASEENIKSISSLQNVRKNYPVFPPTAPERLQSCV